MRTAGSVLGVALLIAALGGCSHQATQGATAQSPQAAQTQTQARSVCPLAQLEGVQAYVADTGDGVAITFTGPQSALSQLKQNVRGMKEANDTRGDPFVARPEDNALPVRTRRRSTQASWSCKPTKAPVRSWAKVTLRVRVTQTIAPSDTVSDPRVFMTVVYGIRN